MNDVVNALTEKLDTFDGILVGSPVYYAGATGQITGLLDRLFYVNFGKMQGKVVAAVVNCRRGGATATFDVLNKYFAMSNMFVISSQYWNICTGTHQTMSKEI